MKNKAFLGLLAILVLASCEEKEPKPVIIDPFIGSWEYHNSNLGLDVAFGVARDGEGYTFNSISVDYSEVPEDETLGNYEIEVFDKFAANDGFGEIKIFASNDTTWVILILTYNSIVKISGEYVMNVREMEVHMINRNPISLEGQRFTH